MLVYIANNLPYSALSGVLTGSMAERNSLSSYRFVAVMVAQFIIQVLLLPLVLILGGGDKARGFHNTMALFAVVGTVFFLITFFTTRERIVPAPEQKSSIRQDLADLARNKPWLVMLTLTILLFVNLALKGGMYIYYFKYYLDETQLAKFLDGVGFNGFIAGLNGALTGMGLTEFQWPRDAATSAFSVFNAGGIIFMIIGIGFSKRLADRFGKRDVFGGALFVSTLCLLAFYLYSPRVDRARGRLVHPARLLLRHHDTAALGDDRRRGGLLGVEEPPPRHRDHLLGDALRTEDRAQRRRRARRGYSCVLRLRREPLGAVAGSRPRHPAVGQHLLLHPVPAGRRAAVPVRGRQAHGNAHRAGARVASRTDRDGRVSERMTFLLDR